MVVADYKGEYSQQNYYIILTTWHVVAFFPFAAILFFGIKTFLSACGHAGCGRCRLEEGETPRDAPSAILTLFAFGA